MLIYTKTDTQTHFDYTRTFHNYTERQQPQQTVSSIYEYIYINKSVLAGIPESNECNPCTQRESTTSSHPRIMCTYI